jgi:HSP20 family protein
MDELFTPDWMGGAVGTTNLTIPPVNIRETEISYEVELSAPGKKKADFNIEVDNGLLTISSESKIENTTADDKYTRREFQHSSFKRSFSLPETVKEDDIQASYESGILKINLPKRDEALPKPKRAIEIS